MPDLRGENALVTGAAGFIGAALVRALLAAGAEVSAVVRPGSTSRRLATVRSDVRLVETDVRDEAAVRALFAAARPAVVFHLAAAGVTTHGADPARTLSVSVLGTHNVLEAASHQGFARFVHVGGSSEYGPRDRPLREDDEPLPVTVYGAAKASATLLARRHARATGEPIVVVRPFSVYGPREAATRLVPSAVAAGIEGAVLPLTAPGIARDWVFVDDVAGACIAAAAADLEPGTVLNAGTGVQHTNEEVVAEIGRALGTTVRVDAGAFPARASDTNVWVADTTRAERMLGWRASHDLRSGIAETVAWQLAGADS